MYVDTKETSFVDVSHPSLTNLAFILRHKELWPKGFHWDFRGMSTCAMGMCYELWNIPTTSLDGFENDFDGRENYEIFCRPVSFFKHPLTRLGQRMAMVTPEMVADRIDQYLARQ